MNSYAQQIRDMVMSTPENTIISASDLYLSNFSTIPEKTYYYALKKRSFAFIRKMGEVCCSAEQSRFSELVVI